MISCDIKIQKLIHIQHFWERHLKVIILRFIHIHTRKHQIDAKQGKK